MKNTSAKTEPIYFVCYVSILKVLLCLLLLHTYLWLHFVVRKYDLFGAEGTLLNWQNFLVEAKLYLNPLLLFFE